MRIPPFPPIRLRLLCILPLAALPACDDGLVTDPLPADPPAMAAGSGDTHPPETATTAVHLGTLGGESTSALGINNRVEVVGTSENAEGVQRAFLWTEEEGMQDLGGLSDGAAAALDINDSGEIIGWSEDGEGARVATRWLPGGGIEALPRPAHSDDRSPSAAWAINSRGDVVGFIDGDVSTRWPAEGGVQGVCGLRGYPMDINDSGTVVGVASAVVGGFLETSTGSREYSGFIRTGRDPSCRGLIDDDFVSQDATGINNRGDVVGWGGEYEPWPDELPMLEMLSEDVPHLYTDHRGFRTEGSLPEFPRAINNRGVVVGGDVMAINDAGDRVGGAYLWTSRANAVPRIARSEDADAAITVEGRAAAAALADAVPSVATRALSAEVEAGLKRCPEALAHMVRIAALPACPVPEE